MVTSLRALAALSAAALLAACGNDSSSSEQPLDLQGFAARYADTICGAYVECSCSDASARADCTTAYTEFMLLEASQMLTEYPGIKIDPAKAQTCLTDMATALKACPSPTGSSMVSSLASPFALSSQPVARTSGTSFVDVPSCQQNLLVGTRTADQYCDSWRECGPGLACDRLTRACVTAPGIDESCESTGSTGSTTGCASGLYCDGTYHCVAIPAEDDACDSALRVCAEGTSCVQVSGEYTCVAPHAVDDSCADGAGCVTGAYCDGTSTCASFIPDGGDCEVGWQCAHGWCNEDGKCADPGFCSMVNSDL